MPSCLQAQFFKKKEQVGKWEALQRIVHENLPVSAFSDNISYFPTATH